MAREYILITTSCSANIPVLIKCTLKGTVFAQDNTLCDLRKLDIVFPAPLRRMLINLDR